MSETRSWVGSGEGRINEDCCVVDDKACCAVLVDGATGLTKANLVKGTTDAAWYAQGLAHGIVGRVAQGHPFADAMALAGQDIADSYLTLHGARDLRREDLPNGSVAVFGWDERQLTVAMLGDCTAVIGLRGGACEVIHDATLDELDQQSYARMYAYACEHNTSMKAARKAVNSKFIENRLKMNEPGGYWAADVTCRGFGHELMRTFPLGDVRFAFACTDGFASAIQMGVVANETELATEVYEGHGSKLGLALRKAELEDEGCWRVHRSKMSDDATYVLVSF